ncbi:hypothetical protein [Sphingomonas solaris]|uniref:Uncharacterized protein n=1 Tax=Alterirhizorhabdus solaris TaxID=2529389 RepID=A0A558R8A6_9SPHN|nr:hypothetical protein [Sphingomonas solaris]TVV75558.1 hypothetical protein FOY91_06775 [Sphingomonas solaris]
MGKGTKVRTTAKRDVLADTAAASDLPHAQRDSARLHLAETNIVDGHTRTASETVRRLTRVELLERAGVLERHEAQACDWYAEIAALAWDTTGCTANYEGGRGGGGAAHAPDSLMARFQTIADARADYAEARKMLGETMGDAFEAIVCRNEALGPAAATAFPELKRSQAGERLRSTVKFCANVLHQRFGKLMGWLEAAERVAPRPAVARAPTPAPAPVERQLHQDVVDAVAAAHRDGVAPDELWMAATCHAALCRELRLSQIVEVEGLLVVVRDDWRWGYVPIASGRVAMAA